jgi:hypothetical protein
MFQYNRSSSVAEDISKMKPIRITRTQPSMTTKTYRLRWWLTLQTMIRRARVRRPTITVYIVTRETASTTSPPYKKSADRYNKPE